MIVERGHIYRAKKPKHGWYCDDRQVLFVTSVQVQYDSPTVRNGGHYPTIDRLKFEAWAGDDVTEGYPKDDWAKPAEVTDD